tara:strand:+ start:694 stop:1428 length:735 start_codon:yes stop_codon:yes gene_type:complete
MLIHASAEENIIEKNDKYSNINQDNFFYNAYYKSWDLQGWRNKIIKALPKIFKNKKINVADLGAALGDKLFLIDELCNVEKAYWVDYSDVAYKYAKKKFATKTNYIFFKDDIIKSLDNIPDKSIDVITMFGFLHEVQIDHHQILFQKIRKKLTDNGIILLSDNNLYFSPEHLYNGLIDSKFEGSIFVKTTEISRIKFFFELIRNNKKNKIEKKKIRFVLHPKRIDSIVGFFGKDSEQLTKFLFK